MISPQTAILLIGFGELSAVALIVAGAILHMRWIDRKLNKPQVKPPAQKPAGGTPA